MNTKHSERGAVLVFSLIVIVTLCIITGAILKFAIQENQNTLRSANMLSAINVAEAAVEKAMWELNYNSGSFSEDSGWTSGSSEYFSGALQTSTGENVGDYELNVYNASSNNPVVEATAYVPSQAYPRGKRTVRAVLTKESSSGFTMAAFGVDSVTMCGGASTDSYDSRDFEDADGDGNPDSFDSNGDVGTNATGAGVIDINGTSKVDGDVFIGESGDTATAVDNNGTITGSIEAQTTNFTPESITAPTDLVDRGTISMGNNSTLTISESGEYDGIELGKNSVITIENDVVLYVTGDLFFKKDSSIDIAEGGSLTLYLDGGLRWNKDGDFNNTSKDPTKLIIYGTEDYTDDDSIGEGEDGDIEYGISIRKDTLFYGVIYAPNASITVRKDSEIYGAVIGKNIDVRKDTAIHYDEALGALGGGSEKYTIVYWQEK